MQHESIKMHDISAQQRVKAIPKQNTLPFGSKRRIK